MHRVGLGKDEEHLHVHQPGLPGSLSWSLHHVGMTGSITAIGDYFHL